MNKFNFESLPSFWWSFSTEIACIMGIISILVYCLCTKRYWNLPGYNLSIFIWVIAFICYLIFLIYITEIEWHLTNGYWTSIEWKLISDVPNEYFSFYGTNRFISSLPLALSKIFLLILVLICLILYKIYFKRYAFDSNWEYAPLILIITLSMLMLISTIDCFYAFMFLELQSLALYILGGLKRYSNLSIEATQKFFYFASFSSCCFGLGLSLLYGLTGTVNLYELNIFFSVIFFDETFIIMGTNFTSSFIAILGCTLILISLLFKLSLVPFYFWVGDVFQGTYGYFGSFLAIITKLPVIIFFIKYWYWLLFIVFPFFAIILKFIGLISIIIGSIYSFTELNFKRFWALTAIVHMGYIILALSLGPEGFSIAFFYLFFYLINSLFIWSLFIHFIKQPLPNSTMTEFLTKLTNWIALFRHGNKTIAVCFSFILFSLAGLPPAPGFLPKLLIFYNLYIFHDFFMLFLILGFHILSMSYYIRFARFLLFGLAIDKDIKYESFEKIPFFQAYFWIIIFLLNIFCLIFFMDIWLLLDTIGINFIKIVF